MDATQVAQIGLDPETLQALTVQMVATLKEVCGANDQGMEALKDMPNAWVKQKASQVRKLGQNKAPWICYWIDPDKRERSKTCGPGPEGKRLANKLKRQVEAELTLGVYGSCLEKGWEEFEAEYLKKVAGLSPLTLKETRTALAHFRRLCKPGRVSRVTTATIDQYKSLRLAEEGLRRGETVSHATCNKELRHLRTVLRKAAKWGYTQKCPDFDFLRELEKLPCYVPPEEFVALYQACHVARLPRVQGIDPPDYWRALLVLIYTTGWRIEQCKLLRRDSLNLETGELFSDAADNKGGRDVRLVLPAVTVEHLRKLSSLSPTLFPWPHRQATLWREFHRIQDEANVWPDRKPHFGFHDIRRSFATENADRMALDVLQRQMQHKAFSTTQKYVNMAKRLKPAAENVYVPELPKSGTA